MCNTNRTELSGVLILSVKMLMSKNKNAGTLKKARKMISYSVHILQLKGQTNYIIYIQIFYTLLFVC